ncbi:SRPBCC domain-containing protein [Chloroflexi bacterium TSY]|nr:SRPBCC domain-containing protein [Chloroflexi bacterium TSY]
MSQVQESITIQAGKTKVFDAFVRHIDEWWPRLGTYRYTFVQAPQKPLHIRFEPKEKGRFYETFSDGSSYEIGKIIQWNPPDRLCYTWRDPHWSFDTIVDVTFRETNGTTTVTICHSGFGENDIPDIGVGYHTGLAEILSAFARWFITNIKSLSTKGNRAMQIHFWTHDIDEAIRYYTETLGFALTFAQPDGGPFDFCILTLNEQRVMFGIPPTELIALNRNDKPLLEAVLSRLSQVGPLSIYFSVLDVEAHYANATEHRAQILEPLWKTPWGLIQYSLIDMDGQLLTFYTE